MKEFKTIKSDDVISFDELSINDQFIIDFTSCIFFACKASENFAVIINADNEFCVVQRFINRLSIGWGLNPFNSYTSALRFIEKSEKKLKEFPNYSFVTPHHQPMVIKPRFVPTKMDNEEQQ